MFYVYVEHAEDSFSVVMSTLRADYGDLTGGLFLIDPSNGATLWTFLPETHTNHIIVVNR